MMMESNNIVLWSFPLENFCLAEVDSEETALCRTVMVVLVFIKRDPAEVV